MLESKHSTFQEVMPTSVFPSYDELKNMIPLTWPFVAYGIFHGFIGAESAVSYCLDEITRKGTADDYDTALLDASTDEGLVLELLRSKLPADAQEVHGISLLWMRVLLWMCCQKVHDVDQLLDYVELVYAEFGYPKEIAPFVRYMPSCGIASDKVGLSDALKNFMIEWRRSVQDKKDVEHGNRKEGLE